jgi:hypothetical protein
VEQASFGIAEETCRAHRIVVSGEGEGAVLATTVPLSFWGGLNPHTGEIVDGHHPLCGSHVSGRVLVMPFGRGSSSASGVLLEAIVNERAPSAILLSKVDEIIALGAIAAQEIFARHIPLLVLDADTFEKALRAVYAKVKADGSVILQQQSLSSADMMGDLQLSERDRSLLAGAEGPARQTAMRILVRMAELQGAPCFLDIQKAHIDGCIYTGEASLRFAELLADLGGQVCVPTTMNAISIDQRRWRELGVDPDWAAMADRLAQAYVRMGAKPTFTCAPYQLPGSPVFGEQIAWAESNAVVFANSVLGARTNRYGDLMDICAALTGRVPYAGYHLDENRRGTVLVELPDLGPVDSSFYPVLGYLIGGRVDTGVPVIAGLTGKPTPDDLKMLGAAAATSGAVALFHVVGVTPEAASLEEAFGGAEPQEVWKVTRDELADAWRRLSTARSGQIELVALGNPHFSSDEFRQLAELTKNKRKHSDVEVLITTSRHVHEEAMRSGAAEEIERFGARVITDTCFCMLQAPVIPEQARTLMTNSAKYAHYAPGLVGRDIYFASLADCVQSAVAGQAVISQPSWLA